MTMGMPPVAKYLILVSDMATQVTFAVKVI